MRHSKKPALVKPERIVVNKPDTLLNFLIATFPNRKRSLLKKVMGGGQIKLGKTPVKAFDYKLKQGDVLNISWQKPIVEKTVQGIKVIHNDKDLIVINKQAGLLSVSGKTFTTRNAYYLVKNYLEEEEMHSTLFVVNRLDKEASGVMVFAKSKAVYELLQQQIYSGNWHHEYLTVCDGAPSQKDGVLTHLLAESKALKVYATKNKNEGKEAVTDYSVLKEKKGFSLIKLVPKTFRKNQIRVQLQTIGHTIVGDKKYESNQNPIKRLGLHSSLIQFKHPTKNENVTFKSPTPAKFNYLV